MRAGRQLRGTVGVLKGIGCFDSGAGGLTVVRRILAQRPDAAVTYLADGLHWPYGERSMTEVAWFTRQAVQRLQAEGLDPVIIACNTGSVAWPAPERGPGGTVLDMLAPVRDEIARRSPRRVLVLATRATVDSGRYLADMQAACPRTTFTAMAAQGLVSLVEEGQWTHDAAIKSARAGIEADPQADLVVLACTHFGAVTEVFEELLGAERVLDPGMLVARQALATSIPAGDLRLLTTGRDPRRLRRAALRILGHLQRPLRVERVQEVVSP